MKPQRALHLVVILIAAVGSCSKKTQVEQPSTESTRAAMRAADPVAHIHFIDVGQANAILIECPCGAVLYDAGAQDDLNKQKLLDYLDAFFGRRTDLHKTIKTVIVSHNHVDHASALEPILRRYTVEHYVDNGQTQGSGRAYTKWARDNAHTEGRNIDVLKITEESVEAAAGKSGLTNEAIDPLKCDRCDPQLRLLTGQRSEDPGWPSGAFENENNQSLVLRFDFGESSALFTGDLEEPAIDTLVDYYKDTRTLDVDLWQVGHHGSRNGTTMELLDAMTLRYAVICVGRWDFGKEPPRSFSTYAYGHPRKVVIDLLESNLSESRVHSKRVMVATAARRFRAQTVRKGVYATGWDGDVVFDVPLHGLLHRAADN